MPITILCSFNTTYHGLGIDHCQNTVYNVLNGITYHFDHYDSFWKDYNIMHDNNQSRRVKNIREMIDIHLFLYLFTISTLNGQSIIGVRCCVEYLS